MELPKFVENIKDKFTDPETRHEVIDAAKHLKDAIVHGHSDPTAETENPATDATTESTPE